MFARLSRWLLLWGLVTLATAFFVGTSGFVAVPTAVEAELSRDLAVVDPELVGVSAVRLERLDAGMQAMVDSGKLAGVVTMLARHGKIVFTDAVGTLDVRKRDPVELNSIFRIFSMTKPVVGVALMLLHEEGKWQLNDPVSNYIPAFANLQVYTGQDDSGKMVLQDIEQGRRITMRDLMKHTAGLGYVLDQRHPVNRLIIDRQVLDSSLSLQTMIDKLIRIPLLAQPGTRWAYSISVDVQGYLVEQISGQPLAEFLHERIFEPLGMLDTAFYVPPGKRHRVSAYHSPDREGGLTVSYTGRGALQTSPPAGPSGGGGLYGTAPDYLRFAQMLANGGELDDVRLLSPRTVELMSSSLLTEVEQASYRRLGQGWGLNVSVVTDGPRSGESWSTGSYYWIGIAGTWFWVDPEEDLTFVGMIQHSGGAILEVQQLSRSLVYQAVIGD